MNDAKLKISVWMTCYNHERYIREAVQSVLDQTLRPFEILISDDCSNDNTPNILKEYERKYPDLIRVYYQPQRLGITKNKNFIIKKVRGDYITWLDGDDRFHPQKLETEFAALKRHPEAGIVFSNVDRINEKGEFCSPWIDKNVVQDALSYQKERKTIPALFFPEICFVDKRFAHVRNEMISKDVLKTCGCFDEEITLWQDFEFRIRVFQKFKAVYCDAHLSDYRNHETAASRAAVAIHLRDLICIYNKHIKNIHNWKLQLHWCQRLQARNVNNRHAFPRFSVSICLSNKCANLMRRVRGGAR